MTRDKAIKWIKYLRDRYSKQADEYEVQGALIPMDALYPYIQALDFALSALRPVSRERVEKVFGGKWEEETYTTVSGRGRVIHSKKCRCSACGKANGRAKTNFCPHCGASQTDEAVEMVMERLEALNDV